MEIDAVSAVIAAHPRHAPALVRRGELHRQIADYRESRGRGGAEHALAGIADFTAALALKPRSTTILRARAGLHAWLGFRGAPADVAARFDAAEQDLTRALEIDPSDAETTVSIAVTLRTRARAVGLRTVEGYACCRRAIEMCDRAAQLRPDSAMAYYEYGFVYREYGDSCAVRGEDPVPAWESALRGLERVVKINPKHNDVYRVMSMIRTRIAATVEQGGGDPVPHYRAALGDIDRAFAIDPTFRAKYAGYLLQQGAILCFYGDYEASRSIDPTGRYETAVASLGDAVKLNPRNWDIRRYRASANMGLGAWRGNHRLDPTAALEAAIADFDFNLREGAEHPNADAWRQQRDAAQRMLEAWRK